MERGPAVTPGRPFCTQGWIPTGPMDLGTLSWYRWSLSVSVSTRGKPLSQHSWASSSGDWAHQGLSVSPKTETKHTWNASAFSSPLLGRWPSPTRISPMFSLHLPLLLMYFKKPFCYLKQHWPVSTVIELWPLMSSPCIDKSQLCNPPEKPDLASRDSHS